MNRLPKIGERVRYTSAIFPDRTLTGKVIRIYPGDRCVDDEGEVIEQVRVGDPEWEEYWSASVEHDERPDWWQHGDCPRFAPSIAELEPEVEA